MKNGCLIVLMLTLLTGCVTARIEESRTSNTGLGSDEALVILGRAS